MSLKSWMKEFYPKPAALVAKQDAIDHSLRKWEGLTKKSLAKHNVELSDDRIGVVGMNGEVFELYGGTCALCAHHAYPSHRAEDRCKGCPLFQLRSKPCDVPDSDEKSRAPWASFTINKNPNPMIRLLRKAKKVSLKVVK